MFKHKTKYFKIVFTFLFALLMTANASASNTYQYKENSVLSTGKWAKIKIKSSGICKITYDEIRNMGFSNPSQIRVFGYGGAMLPENFGNKNSRKDDLPEISLYDGGNYILFYAQGPISWNYSASSKSKFNFTINPYADYGCYFLTTDAGEGKRIEKAPSADAGGEAVLDVSDFLDYTCIKKEEYNFIGSGRVWYGDIMYKGNTKNYNFSFPNIEKEKEMTLQLVAAGASSSATSLNISCDGKDTTIQFLSVSGYVVAYESSALIRKLPVSDNVSLSLKYSAPQATDKAAVNYITVNAWRKLIMTGSSLFFRNPDCVGDNNYSRFTLQNASSGTLIWNITDPLNVKEVSTVPSGSNLQFLVKTDALFEYAAVNPSGNFLSAEFVGIVSNQNLHATPSTTDFVIITHPDFLSEAQRLAQEHAKVDNLEVTVVTPEQIYNEFSSGTPDATAYRWFMKMLFDRDGENNSKYLLLFGDGTYDNKGILSTAINPASDFLLTFQSNTSVNQVESFCSDDYFGFLQDNEVQPGKYGLAGATVDIGIGRFPVKNLTEAANTVNKAISYMENKNKGAWKNKICLIADDNEKYTTSTTFNKFVDYSEKYSNMIYANNPSMEVKKIYFDAYLRVGETSGGRFPEVETVFNDEINNGVFFLNYVGHSNTTAWAEERIFTQAQARNLRNKNLGFWFTASCDFTKFDGYQTSGGEDLFLNPNGGAIAVYSANRVVYDSNNDALNSGLFKNLFNRDDEGRPIRFGDLYRLSKQGLQADSNKLSFILLADPALRLAYPDLIAKTTSIELVSSEPTDTLKALSEIRVSGIIEDDYQSLISNFNGKIWMKVYDKELELQTKGQVKDGNKVPMRYTYKDRPNILFSGEADVKDGRFSFVFRMPKDINYNYGFGRINYYAADENNGFEAQGYYEDFIVGGSSDAVFDDVDGPEVSLYINSENFKNGDKVNDSPVLYVTAKDPNGINSSGVGIGHDITLKLNSNDQVVLNSSFNYLPNSSTEGSLVYQMSNLAEGEYTLTFKIWDLINNSTTKQLNFEVVKGLPLRIETITATPNPAKDFINFYIQHDRPETILDYKLSIYDLSGKKIYEISDDDYLSESQNMMLTWNLTAGGMRLHPGVYVYRLEMRTTAGDYVGKAQKLIIMAQ